MSKKEKKIFKIIADVRTMLGRLHELTGNELKVWMYLWLRTNGELTTFPANKTMAQELQINIDTVKEAKRGLREKGWTGRETQRVRDNGTFSTVVERVYLPWGKKASSEEEKSTHGTVAEKTDDGKFHQQKEDSKILKERLRVIQETPEEAGLLASQLASESRTQEQEQEQHPTPAAHAGAKNLTPTELLALESKEVQTAANEILYCEPLWLVLGLPYFTDADIPPAISLARVLVSNGRSVGWLSEMAKWMKQDSFWKKRLHSGARAMGQLAKHAEAGEVVAQFDSHVVVDFGKNAMISLSQQWFDIEELRASANSIRLGAEAQ